jgi:hypothetical protein
VLALFTVSTVTKFGSDGYNPSDKKQKHSRYRAYANKINTRLS